jgi:peptidyl-prolyl cis-trans isomerase SurA
MLAKANEPYKQEWTDLSGSTQDAIVANVGGQILLLSDLRRSISLASRGQADVNPAGELIGSGLTAVQAEEILDKLIEQSLLELKVKELSLEVSASELDAEITQFLEQRKIQRTDFLDMLASEGETEQSHRSEFKRQLETQRFIGRVIKPLVSVSDEEVRSFYLSQRSQGATTIEKVVLRSLMLKGSLSDIAVQSRVDQITSSLRDGATFEDLTHKHSDAPDAKTSKGLLPARKLSELHPTVVEQLSNKNDGTVIGPVQLGSSSFLFEIVKRETSEDSKYNAEKETWRQKLLEKKFGERLDSYLKAERTKVRVEKRPLRFATHSSPKPVVPESQNEG